MKRAHEYPIAAQVWALRKYGEVGPRTFRALMAYYGNLAAILEAEIDELEKIDGLSEKKARKINGCFSSLAEAELFINRLKERNIGVATIFDDSYPSLFSELNDPPPIIFYQGRLPSPGEKTAAIVGSHKADNNGIRIAVEIAAKLARENVSIVSGLARGIDAAGHIGALKEEGITYAVLGSGFDNIFPEENRPLASQIIKKGGLISEYPPDTGYADSQLIARNRLTVGLSQAVVIGEIFGDSKGTLDTASFCRQLGKIMFVLIDASGASERDLNGIEKVLNMGAIPVRPEKAAEMILKALV
jgi:DNA processing protein